MKIYVVLFHILVFRIKVFSYQEWINRNCLQNRSRNNLISQSFRISRSLFSTFYNGTSQIWPLPSQLYRAFSFVDWYSHDFESSLTLTSLFWNVASTTTEELRFWRFIQSFRRCYLCFRLKFRLTKTKPKSREVLKVFLSLLARVFVNITRHSPPPSGLIVVNKCEEKIKSWFRFTNTKCCQCAGRR